MRARGTGSKAVPGKRIPPMINVLHVVCYPELYGTQRSMLSTVRCLDRDGFAPFVAAPPAPDFEAQARRAGADFLPVPMRGPADMRAAAQLRRIIEERSIHIVHCHLGISSVLGLLAARSRGAPAVVTRHLLEDRYTTIANPAVRAAYRGVYRWMNARFARIICVSRGVRDNIIAREGAPPHKCVIIPNGVPLPDRGQEVSAASPGMLPDLPHGRRIAVCVSRLSREKGLPALVQTLEICVRQGHDICVVIAGTGPLREALLEQARVSGIADRLILPGFVEDVRGLLEASHVFVLPTLQESFGISILEAMAAGLPVIATETPGPSEIVEHEINGLLVPPSDPEALARAMIRVIGDQALSDSLRRGGLARAAQFDERAVARSMENLYREVLGEGINSAVC